MPSGSKVMELHREVYNKNEHHSKVYWRLAGAMGLKYYYQFCKPVLVESYNERYKRKNYFNADFHIFNLELDLNKFEENLKKFCLNE